MEKQYKILAIDLIREIESEFGIIMDPPLSARVSKTEESCVYSQYGLEYTEGCFRISITENLHIRILVPAESPNSLQRFTVIRDWDLKDPKSYKYITDFIDSLIIKPRGGTSVDTSDSKPDA